MTFTAELLLYPGQGGWHFVTLPADIADELRARSGPRRGFGSGHAGGEFLATSVFPDTKSSFG